MFGFLFLSDLLRVGVGGRGVCVGTGAGAASGDEGGVTKLSVSSSEGGDGVGGEGVWRSVAVGTETGGTD